MPHLTAGTRRARVRARRRASAARRRGRSKLALTSARLDWPRSGAPRLHAALAGELSSPLLRTVLQEQGLERLSGDVALEADARGEKELRQPDLWRVTARVSDATVPLGGGLPPVEKLTGTVRYADRQLRALALEGSWLGGPVEIEIAPRRRRGQHEASISASAASPMRRRCCELLGHGAVAEPRRAASSPGAARRNGWRATTPGRSRSRATSRGVESRLPEPFDKTARARCP